MSIASTIDPAQPDPALTGTSSGFFNNTAPVGSPTTPLGYNFGRFGNVRGPGGVIQRDTGTINGQFEFNLADNDFNSCPDPGGEIGFRLTYVGDSATAENMWISDVFFGMAAVPPGMITRTLFGSTVVFDIAVGDPTPGTYTYDFTLQLDTPSCAPVTDFLLIGTVTESCPACDCSVFTRACQTTFARIDPDDFPNCNCNYTTFINAERTTYGYTDRTQATPLTNADFPGVDHPELDRWMPGDIVEIEGLFVLDESDAFNGRTERLDFIIGMLQGGSARLINLLGRLDVNAARLQSFSVHRGATTFDAATIAPTGGINGTFDGVGLIGAGANVWDNAMHPGLQPGTYKHGSGNSSDDYQDGRLLRAYWGGEDDVDPGGFNALAALYDLVGGAFMDSDTVRIIWQVPVILTPDILANGDPTMGPPNDDMIILRGSIGAYDALTPTVLSGNFAQSGAVFDGTNGATACIYQDTAFVHDPGITLSSAIRYDADGCAAEIEHDFTIADPIPDDWYQSPTEYRPIIGMERLFSEWPDPYIYSGGATYELLGDGNGAQVQEPDSINGAEQVGDAHCPTDRYGELVWLDSEKINGLRKDGYDDFDTETDVSLSGGTFPLIGVGAETMTDPDTLAFLIPLTRLCTDQPPETPVEAAHESSYPYLADYKNTSFLCNDGRWYFGVPMTNNCTFADPPADRQYWPWTRDSINNPHRFGEAVTFSSPPPPSIDIDLTILEDQLMDLGGMEANTVTVCPAAGESLAGGVMIIEVPSNVNLEMGAPTLTEEMSTDSSIVYSVQIPTGLPADQCFDLVLTTSLLFCGPNPICISAVPCPADAELVLLKMLECVEEVCYNYRAGVPELQAGFEYPVNPSPCVTQDYEVNFNNTGTSFLDSMCVVIYVPNGLMLMPAGSFEVTVTEGMMASTMTIPIAEETALTGVSGIAYKLDSTALNMFLGEGGLEPGGTIEVNFMGETDCDYVSGSSIATIVTAAGDCDPFEFFDRGQPLDVVDPEGGADFSVNVEPLEISCEDGGSDIRITAINTGKTVVSDATVCLVLPPELTLPGGMDGITIVAPLGFMIENYEQVPVGTAGAMAISFDAPEQNVGDFFCLDLGLSLDGDAPCGPIEFIFDIKTTQTVDCPSTEDICDLQVSGNPLPFTLQVQPDAKLVDALLTAQCGPGEIDLNWELELMSLTSDMLTLDIEFFQDLNQDGMVDDFDIPVGTAAGVTFNFGSAGGMDRQTGTIMVDATMACPLVARVDFPTGCACSMLEVAFPQAVPDVLGDLGDAFALCPGIPLEIDECAGLELALVPAAAGTIDMMAGASTAITLNPGFGVLSPVELVASYAIGNCNQEFVIELTQLETFDFPDLQISACRVGDQQIDLGIPNELEEDITVSITPDTYLDDPMSQEPTLMSPAADIMYTVTYTLNPGPDECVTTAMIEVTVFDPPAIVDLEYVLECSEEAMVPLMEVATITPDGLDGTWGTLGDGMFAGADTRFSTGMLYIPSMDEFDSGEVMLTLTTDPIMDTINGVPVIVCGPARDTITIQYNCVEILITKEVDTIYASAIEGEFVVKYFSRVTNLGTDLDSVEVLDDLDTQLGAAYVRVCDLALDGMEPLVLSEPATLPGNNISANPNWGTGGDWELTEFDQDTLFETDSFAFCMCIVVDPDAAPDLDSNTVTVNGESTVTGTETADTAGARFEIPAISLAKFVDPALPPTENADDPNNFDVSYCWVVTNVGNVSLDSITLIDDFGFYGPAFTGTILSPPMVTMSDNPAIAANMAWNPTTPDIDLITPMPPGDVLEPGEAFTVCTRVVIDPSQSPLGDTLFNIAATTGMDENGTEVQDSSDNGMEPEGPGYEDPTPLLLPQIALAKFVDPAMPPTENADDPNNFDVSYCWVVENTGNVPLDSITLVDDFAFYGPAFTGVILSPPAVTMSDNPAITSNPDWNPTTAMNDLILPMPPGDILQPGETFTVCTRVVIDPSLSPMGDTLFNIAATTGTDPNGTMVVDSSDNGMDPDSTNMMGGYDDPTPLLLPQIALAKFVDPDMPPTVNPDDPNNFDVSFCWVVENTGNVPLDSVTLVDDFAFYGPAFTGVVVSPPTVTMSDNPAIAANMAWNPTTPDIDLITPMPPGDVLQPGESFTVCTRVVIDPSLSPMGDTLFNIAATTGNDPNGTMVVDSSDNGMDPDSTNMMGGFDDPTPLLLPAIALAKFVDPGNPPVYPAASGIQGNVDVTFCFTVENTGNVPLDSIVLFEDFGMYGAAVVGVTTPPSISMNNSDLVNLAPNLTWDPLASMFDLIEPTTMFANGDTLQPNDNFTVCATIEINLNANLPDFDSLLNQAVTMGTDPNGTDVEDLSDNGMDPDSTNMMGGFDDPTPFAFPAIGLAKNIVNTELLGPPDFPVANFAVTYEFVLENIGNVPLDSLQLCDDVNAQYGLPGAPVGPFVSVISQPMITASDADIDPVLTGTYDGGITAAGACMFDGMSGSIIPGQTVTLQMTLQVNPNAMTTPDEPLLNSGTVTGRDSSGVQVMDISDDGTDAEEDNMEGGYSDPTGLILFDINIAKTISNWTPNTNPWEPGHGEATFVMNVKNKGNTPVADVAVVDDIMAMYGPLFVRVTDPPVVTVVDNPGGFPNPVVSPMGMTNPDYLSGPSQDTVWVADTIQANVTVSIEFTLELNPNAPGRPEPALNQASVAATDRFGNPLMDDSDSGTDPEGTNQGEVGDSGGEDDATVGLFPSINLAKTIDTVSIPGQFDPHGNKTTNPSTQVIVDHIHRIKNTSNVTLDSIRLNEPVGDPMWYGQYGAFLQIYGQPVIEESPAAGMFMVNPDYDGLGDAEVLVPNPNMDGSDSLQVDEEIVIRIRVLIDVKFVPADAILFNQSVTTGRGVFPGGNLGDVTDLSDSGTDAESENPDDRLRNALDLPNTGHDDPTPLPNCFDCSVNCVTSLSASFDENCEYRVDNETIKAALPSLNPICVDLGFYDFKLENEHGGKAANPMRGDRTKDEECNKFIPFNRLCPNVTCWTQLCIKRIDLPIIKGTKYTVYCDDPLLDGPLPGEMPVALISCEGEATTEFIADWTDVRECTPGDDTIKIIYREYAATSRNGNRGIGFDTICVLQLPEITTANTYCTDRDTLYCGVGGPVGPYLIVEDLQPSDGEIANADVCDTIYFVDHVGEGQYEARVLGPKCGILTHVETHNFSNNLCDQVYKITVEIKQTCFGEPTVACPIPTDPANMLEQIGDNYWKCEFWVIDLDTLAPKIACKYEDYEDDNLLWPALLDFAVGQGLPTNVHCYDTPVRPGSSVDAPVILAPTSSHDCAAHTYLPPVCVYEDWSGIKSVKASIDGIGSWVLDAGDSCFITADSVTGICYQYHEPVNLPKSDYPYQIKYEAFDDCHNSEITYCYILVKDRTKPVVVVDKGVTVSLSDKKVWVNAETFDEGSWDNCSDPMIYVRRADWYESCIDLCYNVKDGQCDKHAPEKEAAYEVCYIGEHHDTLWTTRLEDKKECDEVEAHYSKTLDWLAADGVPCGKLMYNAWQYDLIKYATTECRTHPYDVDEAALHKLIIEATEHNGFSSKFACPEMHDFCDPLSDGPYLIGDCAMSHDAIVSEMDKYSQIGGGWSDAVAFDCEDACDMVTVEVLAIDYWCNWSKAWMDVWVEDKTPVQIVHDVVDGDISCKSYRTKGYIYPGEQHAVSIEYIVEQAKAGEAAAFGRLDDLFGGYQKAWADAHGNYVDSTWTKIDGDIEFSDSTCVCETKVERIRKYDEHYGYIWQDSIYEVCSYDTLNVDFRHGIVVVNCADNVQCAQEVWCDIDHCGEGYLFRKFKIWQGCAAGSDAHSPHAVDTLTRHQRIYIGNTCELNLAMFDLPEDVTVEACGVEFDPEGSGNIVGDAGPENTGMPVYTFDDDCRIVGIAREDKPFKVVGGDEGCYKIIRTWYFADWCGGQPENPYWYQDRDLVLDTFVQKILVIDTQPPVCAITTDMVAESGDGTATSPAVFAAQGGCYLNIEALVEVSDPCGIIDLYWEFKDLKSDAIAASGSDALEGDTMEISAISIADVATGSYKLQVLVRDECQNESYCEYYLDVNAGKKPGPVCVTSLTAELQPWDTNQDGTVDTAAATIWAQEFESSSLPPCGEAYEDLVFMIEWTDEASEVYDTSRLSDSLAIGCDRIGTHMARMWVVSPSGSADYCDVILVVQDNNSACSDASNSSFVSGTAVQGHMTHGFELHQNRPNPFIGETAISFNLPKSQRATLTIYDATGRMLQKFERVYDKGYNSITVKLNEVAAQGMLYYQLDTKEFTATRKMTMINY